MSANHVLSFRFAEPADAPILARIEAESWPEPLAATEEQWRARLETFPTGQLVAVFDGEPAAVASAQRITEEFLAPGRSRINESQTAAPSDDRMTRTVKSINSSPSARVRPCEGSASAAG
ncbi:MAG: hypothetical protein QM775_18945 [Pirellulales bacterium]